MNSIIKNLFETESLVPSILFPKIHEKRNASIKRHGHLLNFSFLGVFLKGTFKRKGICSKVLPFYAYF